MSDIETLKLKDTKLINQICDLGDITIDKRRRWSIEFDDYGMSNVIDAIRANERARLIEQACDAVVKESVKRAYNSEGWILKAIRDRFNSSED